ncbi:hypothetical protein [Lachnoclostridium sp. An181]|uniref:hypothetical protein n=1 Tax=Lachnoclostridium sp. An181 TaxID=1965575 RepID=UPI0023B8C6E8|nr:hypothetical protein [Lachnoclostridium sp. An181]
MFDVCITGAGPAWISVSVYAAGDVCAKQVRQAATAVSDGAVAAVNAAAYIKQLEQ